MSSQYLGVKKMWVTLSRLYLKIMIYNQTKLNNLSPVAPKSYLRYSADTRWTCSTNKRFLVSYNFLIYCHINSKCHFLILCPIAIIICKENNSFKQPNITFWLQITRNKRKITCSRRWWKTSMWSKPKKPHLWVEHKQHIKELLHMKRLKFKC